MGYSKVRHLVYVAVSLLLYWYSIFGEFGTINYQMTVSFASFVFVVAMLLLTSEKYPYVPKA